MQRFRRAVFPVALVAALVVAIVIVVGDSAAELDNLVFTSRADRLRMIVPRNWRASDQPSYPGLLLWMAPLQSPGQMDLTVEEFNHNLYCSWPVTCRTSRDATLASKYACALRAKLEARRLRVGPVQAGPRETEDAGLPSVWFEYDDGKHFLRHAIAIAFSSDQEGGQSPGRDQERQGHIPHRAVSLVLSAPTSETRTALSRGFEQALRTLRLLSAEETARAEGIDAAVAVPPDDASTVDSSAIADAAVVDAGVLFGSAPALKVSPVGPCQ